MLETKDEPNKAIRALAEIELADLEAQLDDEDEDNLSDSLDKDYQPI